MTSAGAQEFHHPWQPQLVDNAWDQVLKSLAAQDVGQLRQVSQAWRDETGRALSSLNLVDPSPEMLLSANSTFPGLRNLTATFTHPWSHHHSLGHGVDDIHPPLPTPFDRRPSNDALTTCKISGGNPDAGKPCLQLRVPGCQSRNLGPHLTELAVHGWPGICAACAAGQSNSTHTHIPVHHASGGGVRHVLQVPLPLIQWAGASGKLKVLRITRCAAPTQQMLQVCGSLRELHLVNVDFNMNTETQCHVSNSNVTGPSSAVAPTPFPLATALSFLPHLQVVTLRQQEPDLQVQHTEPSLEGLRDLHALTTLTAAGSFRLLMQVSKQVSGWSRLAHLTLEAVQWQFRDAPTELNDLLTAMAPGSTGLISFSCSGHTYVSDRCVSRLATLFPNLRHVSLPLDEYAQDSSWNPLIPGNLYNDLTQAGLQPLIAGRKSLLGLSLGYVPLAPDILPVVLNMNLLRSLDLSGCRLVDDSVLYRMCSSLHHLEQLILAACNAISDIGLAQLAVGLPHLSHLDISECDHRVTDLGLSRLGALCRLETLNLGGCLKITDVGLRGLLGAPHRQHTALKHLNLSSCHNITDASLFILASHAPALTRLSLDALPSLTPDGIMGLATLRHLQTVSVAWCTNQVQAASARLATCVLGRRLGPLMTVPPGVLEPAVLMGLEEGERGSSGMIRSDSGENVSRSASGSPPCKRHVAFENIGMATSSGSGSVTDGSREGLLHPAASSETVWSEASEMSDTSEILICSTSSASSSPVKEPLRFRSSPSCNGFVPLSEAAPRHASWCWWLPN